MNTVIGIKATLLTPLVFHGLMVDGGSSTIADVLSDKAMAFALAESLGWMPSGVALPTRPSYREHLSAMPFRASMFRPCPGFPAPRLGFPQARKLNIDAECGRPKDLDGVTKSGNVKDYFTVQEIQPGAVYEGMLWWPSDHASLPDEWVVRTGLGRQAMVKIEQVSPPEQVVLNAHTAALFDRPLPCHKYYLHSLQSAPPCSVAEAVAELSCWH